MKSIITDPSNLQMVVKIADLGMARKLFPDEFAETCCGTPLLMSPQVLSKQVYDGKADVWSLGCIFYQLITGFYPFIGFNTADLERKLQKGNYNIPKTIQLSLDAVSFLNSCLQYDPDERASLWELKQHPFLTK